jgi:hypothetical protein
LLLSGAVDLLGIQAHVVGVGEHLLERQPRLVQVPALSLTAQAFLFTIALAKDANLGARVLTGILSVITSLMSIYLILSHRIHAEADTHPLSRGIPLPVGCARTPGLHDRRPTRTDTVTYAERRVGARLFGRPITLSAFRPSWARPAR